MQCGQKKKRKQTGRAAVGQQWDTTVQEPGRNATRRRSEASPCTRPARANLKPRSHELILKGEGRVCRKDKVAPVLTFLCLDGKATFPRKSWLLVAHATHPPHRMSGPPTDRSRSCQPPTSSVPGVCLPYCLRVLPSHVQMQPRSAGN